jgi:hypothetical protein
VYSSFLSLNASAHDAAMEQPVEPKPVLDPDQIINPKE